MPLAPVTRPSGSTAKPKGKAAPPVTRKQIDGAPQDDNADDDEEETTTDDSSDEDTALEMDGQELWTQTYCATCDCLIEPGEGIAKTMDGSEPPAPTPHSTLKSRSGTIKARTSSNTSDHPKTDDAASAGTAGPSNLKRTHSAGRLQARAGTGPLGPHKRTGSAGSRLNALSELRPTTKLHEDKSKTSKAKITSQESVALKGRKSPAISQPGSVTSGPSHSNSSGPSSLKSSSAAVSHNNNTNTQTKAKSRGFLGGLTPAALKQQQAEMSSKRNAPTPLYCSERCRLIDERRSSGLGELAQYLSQPVAPEAWGPAPTWPRSTSMPMAYLSGTPDSECMCPDCLDKYADGASAGGATVPSGASDTATESSSGQMYGRIPVGQKPRTASGRMVTPLNLHAPDAGYDSYFPATQPYKQGTYASPRDRPIDSTYAMTAVREGTSPPQSPYAASAGKVSGSGTDGSGVSSESGSSLWEPRMKQHDNSHRRDSPSHNRQRSSTTSSAPDVTSGHTTTTATPALTPRHSMVVTPLASTNNATRISNRLSVPAFEPTREVDEESHLTVQQSDLPISSSMSKSVSGSFRPHSATKTGPLSLLHKGRPHHAAASVDIFSDHVGSPSAGGRGSLLSQSLASEHTLVAGASGITLPSHNSSHLTTPAIPEHQTSRSFSHADSGARSLLHASDAGSDRPSRKSPMSDLDAARSAPKEDLSLAIGSLRLAQSRNDSSTGTASRRTADHADKRPDGRRLSLFGAVGPADRRGSNAQSIASSGSGSNTSGWLRSLSSAWLSWRGTASPVSLHSDNDHMSGMENSGEWQSQESYRVGRRESDTSRRSGSERHLSGRLDVVEHIAASPARSAKSSVSLARSGTSRDRSAGITPTQSLVTKPTIRRGNVPAYVSEIGQGGIPGDASEHTADSTANSSFSNKTGMSEHGEGKPIDAEYERRRQEKREARLRRHRDIAVLPPLLAPASRSGSSTNLYAQMPRSARAYSSGRTQMFVGSAGSGHGPVPPSPGLLRSPYHSSFALAQDASKAALGLARPNSAAGYHAAQYSNGTSPRTKGLGWGAMTSIAPQPMAPLVPVQLPPFAGHGHPAHHAHHPAAHGHHHSISYGHAAALAARGVHNYHDGLMQGSHRHHHQHHQQAHHAPGIPHRSTASTPRNGSDKPTFERHSTTPGMGPIHRSPTPSVPEDGGEMTSQALTSGEFMSRPNSAMAQQARQYRHSLMPPPRSRSSQSVRPQGNALQPATDIATHASEENVTVQPRPRYPGHGSLEDSHRTWSYDHALGGEGQKTYPILQLPDRETHDVYDPGWGLDAGGLAKHLGASAARPNDFGRSTTKDGQTEASESPAPANASVQKGFQPHRKKLFYFDA